MRKFPLCRFCEQKGFLTPATIADHVEPHRGDRQKFWYGELQSLCATCHSSIKQMMENGKTAIGVDGWPIE